MTYRPEDSCIAPPHQHRDIAIRILSHAIFWQIAKAGKIQMKDLLEDELIIPIDNVTRETIKILYEKREEVRKNERD